MSKKTRQSRILEIIRENSVRTQEELSEFLKTEGWDVTQATVSRDIKELELMKIRVNGEAVYAPPKGDDNEIIKSSVVSAEFAENIVVVKTRAGMAQGVASLVDNMELNSVLGSIAGDDTIMIVTRDRFSASSVCEIIRKFKG